MSELQFLFAKYRGWYNRNRPAFWIAIIFTLSALPLLWSPYLFDDWSGVVLVSTWLVGFLGIFVIGYQQQLVFALNQIQGTDFYYPANTGTLLISIALLLSTGILIGLLIQTNMRSKRTAIVILLLFMNTSTAFFMSLFLGGDRDPPVDPREAVTCIEILSDKTSIGLARYSSGRYIVKSDDDGQHWVSLLNVSTYVDCDDIDIAGETTFTITSRNETVITTDGGATWQVVQKE